MPNLTLFGATPVRKLMNESKRKRQLAEKRSRQAKELRRRRIQVALLAVLLLTTARKLTMGRIKTTKTCRRLPRYRGWWDVVCSTYSHARFKRTFCVSRATFAFIPSKICHRLVRETICEEPISPECRLGICLYRLGQGGQPVYNC